MRGPGQPLGEVPQADQLGFLLGIGLAAAGVDRKGTRAGSPRFSYRGAPDVLARSRLRTPRPKKRPLTEGAAWRGGRAGGQP